MQHAVFFLEVVDDFLLLLVQVGSEGNQQQSKWINSCALWQRSTPMI